MGPPPRSHAAGNLLFCCCVHVCVCWLRVVLRVRHGGQCNPCLVSSFVLATNITITNSIARCTRIPQDLRLDEAAKPQGGMDRGAPSAPPGTPPSVLPAGNLFTRWWWQGCRGRGTSPRTLIDRYEHEVEEQALQHELWGWCEWGWG